MLVNLVNIVLILFDKCQDYYHLNYIISLDLELRVGLFIVKLRLLELLLSNIGYEGETSVEMVDHSLFAHKWSLNVTLFPITGDDSIVIILAL